MLSIVAVKIYYQKIFTHNAIDFFCKEDQCCAMNNTSCEVEMLPYSCMADTNTEHGPFT